jgi:GrpB-like predicted nucleotidyltransferase (UPF0157 family)
MTEPITIQDYDPLWPERFDTLRMRIASALDGLTTVIVQKTPMLAPV